MEVLAGGRSGPASFLTFVSRAEAPQALDVVLLCPATSFHV
jgi:hypothetical protein